MTSFSDIFSVSFSQKNETEYLAIFNAKYLVTSGIILTHKQLMDYVKKLEGYEILYGAADEAFCILFKKGTGNNHYEQSAQIP